MPPSNSSPVSGSVKLAEGVLAADGTFDFVGLPTDYAELEISAWIRLTNASLLDNLRMQFNGDAGATNYHNQDVDGSAATAAANHEDGTTSARVARLPGASADADFWGCVKIWVPGYARAHHKPWLAQAYGIYSTASGNAIVQAWGGTWKSTAAISRVKLFGETSANCKQDSWAAVYGKS